MTDNANLQLRAGKAFNDDLASYQAQVQHITEKFGGRPGVREAVQEAYGAGFGRGFLAQEKK